MGRKRGKTGFFSHSSYQNKFQVDQRCTLHVKHEITDSLEEHVDAYFYNLRRGKTFKNRTPNPEIIQEKMDKIDYMKMSVFV